MSSAKALLSGLTSDYTLVLVSYPQRQRALDARPVAKTDDGAELLVGIEWHTLTADWIVVKEDHAVEALSQIDATMRMAVANHTEARETVRQVIRSLIDAEAAVLLVEPVDGDLFFYARCGQDPSALRERVFGVELEMQDD